MRQEKILILGGGQAQIGLISTAKQMGLYTIVVGIEGNYPGYRIADKVYYTDINAKEDVAAIAEKEQIDGICMCCSDFGLATLGYVCDKLNLTGVGGQSTSFASNKFKMKQALVNLGINTASYKVVRTEEDIQEAIASMQFPLVAKAVDLQGSKGIFLSRNEEELREHIAKAISLSRQEYCIVEEYIEGEEFGAQALVVNGQVLTVMTHGDLVLKHGMFNIPIGHYMPYRPADSAFQKQVRELIQKATVGLGFNNCAVNVDLILRDNTPYIIELTCRAGANQLPEMMGKVLGMNYYRLLLEIALGKGGSVMDGHIEGEKYEYVQSRQLFSTVDGTITDIEITELPADTEYSLFVKHGDKISHFTNSAECIGRALSVGHDYDDCVSRLRSLLTDGIKISVDQKELPLYV